MTPVVQILVASNIFLILFEIVNHLFERQKSKEKEGELNFHCLVSKCLQWPEPESGCESVTPVCSVGSRAEALWVNYCLAGSAPAGRWARGWG